MVLPFSAFDNLIFKRIDELARSQYTKPSIIEGQLRKIVKQEVSPIIRHSEERILQEIKSSEVEITKQIQEHRSQLLREMVALNDTQFVDLKKAISTIIQEEIENIEDKKMKQYSKERFLIWKKALSISKDALSIFADVISIYIFLRAGDSEKATDQALIAINTALSKIKKT